jgi:hypothetical protein
MTPADDAQALQFETAIPLEGAANALVGPDGVTCRTCQQAIPDEYFDVNGQPVCAPCRQALEQHAEPPRGAMPIARAALFGLGAAVAGAILYYAVIAITNFEIGLVAIAIGFMVGYAIKKGTHGRGGRTFQVIAVVLTYWSVGLAYLPLVIAGMREPQASVQSGASDAGTPAPAPAQSPADGDINLPVAVVYLGGFTLALPVLLVFGSLPGGLISAAIIGFGMRQAWVMTAAPQFTISGPFRVGTAAASVT